ncbi:MAG: patatin-like phospholipase family protein [Rhodocyclaceae bacterium]
MAKTALVLGGGAPNATLMSGALVAFAEAGVKFDVISTAGAGALIGLLYVAPAKGTPIEALRRTTEMGVADAIYDHFPVNYKVFQKSGANADLYRRLLAMNPLAQTIATQHGDSAMEKLFSDWVQLLFTSACPSDLSPKSLGLCANVPFLEETVDFAALRHIVPAFYINAYNISDRRMENFAKDAINADHCRAALAFPFLYPPYPIIDPKSGIEKFYYEGAAHDCLNYKALVDHEPDVKRIVVFDVLGADELMRTPRDLYDAWLLSIITPLVEIARDDTKIFEAVHNRNNERQLFKVPFDIPKDHLAEALDWSRSNLETLFLVGYESAKRYLAGDGRALLD